jgi:hypothetical protein
VLRVYERHGLKDWQEPCRQYYISYIDVNGEGISMWNFITGTTRLDN